MFYFKKFNWKKIAKNHKIILKIRKIFQFYYYYFFNSFKLNFTF